MISHGIYPSIEIEKIDSKYTWLPSAVSEKKPKNIKSVWYIGLPLSRAHRGGHSGGGRKLATDVNQSRYDNEGTVYPHAALVEMLTYQNKYFPEIDFSYIDLSHEQWDTFKQKLNENPPDLLVLSAYTATYIWALIVAAQAKIANPNAIVVIGNDHVSCLPEDVLEGKYGRELIDFIGLGNNGPFTILGLISALEGERDYASIPSLGYRKQNHIVLQNANTYPLAQRILPDYRLIQECLVGYYDPAFRFWYGDFYKLKRMVTLPIDSGCHWGAHPKRRCKHCSIQGLTPKMASIDKIVESFETLVGDLGSNVYSTGDSTFGFSKGQWPDSPDFLNVLAERCEQSKILKGNRFMLAYGLISEFEKSAELCSGFVQTWNVGIEAFDPRLLKGDSKSVNKGIETTYRALELAEKLDYKVYLSGILGLPGSTQKDLNNEINCWIEIAKRFSSIITTISVAVPGIIPGSRMYQELMESSLNASSLKDEFTPCRKLSDIYIKKFTDLSLNEVEKSVEQLGIEILNLGGGSPKSIKFGGYALGGDDELETQEMFLLDGLMKERKALQA